MNSPLPADGRATLVRSYRNLSEREIRKRLEGPLSDAERVTAQAELLRRDDHGPDTTFVTGFAPTGTFDPDAEATAPEFGEAEAKTAARSRVGVIVVAVVVVVAVALLGAWRAGLLQRL